MGNHFHLLATAPEGNISSAMLYFMRETSRQITRLSGRINQTYGIRNHKCHVGSYHYFLNCYKYVYQNPVRAGASSRVETYPFSTLHGLCGFSRLLIPVKDELLFPNTFSDSELEWLNRPPKAEHLAEMKIALSRSSFEFGLQRKSRAKSHLEDNLL